ncbi:MAG: glutamate 5-kinase [Ruminococcaceae bacterium]|nr:glutamate 5-kinase [Oscillospiraceae bacterium]
MANGNKRIVIKVGTSTLTHEGGRLNIRRFEKLVKILSDIRNSGVEVVLVSSGAIGVGMGKLGISKRPDCTREKQALASVGQCELMNFYSRNFESYGHTVAQILLTKNVTEDELMRTNARNTFETLFDLNAIPIVNENDTISTEQIEFGDNDTLSAIVAELVEADLLVLLSDIDGLYDKDPHKFADARIIPEVDFIDDSIRAIAGGSGTSRGTGGMVTKICAAEIATAAGVDMIITNGENPDVLYRITDGENPGTLFRKKI